MPILPKNFRPITRNTHIFLFGLCLQRINRMNGNDVDPDPFENSVDPDQPADSDLHCFQKRIYLSSARHGLIPDETTH